MTYLILYIFNVMQIGLMRCGKMLAELTPQKLLERFQCSSLEETFLKLCKAQDNTASLNDAQESEVEDISSGVSYQNQNEQTKVHIEMIYANYCYKKLFNLLFYNINKLIC